MTDHHDEAEAYRNRAERAEQFAGELQAKIDALQQHAEAMAEALGTVRQYALAYADGTGSLFDEAMKRGEQVLANWTAWLIDGGGDG